MWNEHFQVVQNNRFPEADLGVRCGGGRQEAHRIEALGPFYHGGQSFRPAYVNVEVEGLHHSEPCDSATGGR